MRNALFFILACNLFAACSVSSRINSSAQKFVLNDTALQTAHIGISIYEPATGKWWYNYQGNKYFVPASNVKLATCYAAMKYLGDSLVGAKYTVTDTTIVIISSGDPTFLNREFKYQPLYQKLKKFKIIDLCTNWSEEALGRGWAWDDYNESYMAERSAFPVNGNVVNVSLQRNRIISYPTVKLQSAEEFESSVQFEAKSNRVSSDKFSIKRHLTENVFYVKDADSLFHFISIPFRTTPKFIQSILEDTLNARVNIFNFSKQVLTSNYTIIHSQPTDSLLRPMLHRSDNFFAEQSLLMVSNEMLGFMNDEKIIDTLLKTDFKDLPQKPRWVDGSGLSRYNLFTPQDFVTILQKMKNDFGMNRVKDILPTGSEGTLSNYYKADSTAIYAKTGTLSGVVALSGFLTTRKGKELIFSVLVNNHQASATGVRRAIERFIQALRNKL